MGKIFDKIRSSQSIPNAAEIACRAAADHLIVASVSNWGGYALAGSIAVFGSALGLWNGSLKLAADACLPNTDVETSMCQAMIDSGARDGITGQVAMYVDGMPLETSLDVLRQIRQLVTTSDCR